MSEETPSNGDETGTDRSTAAGGSEDTTGPNEGDTASVEGAETPPEGDPPTNPDLEYLIQHLEALEATVDDPEERRQAEYARAVAERLPGSRYLNKQIRKYTTRDMAQTMAGGILLSLPLLVEDGVFDIAAWFVEATVSGVPVFLLGNVAFVLLMTIGLLYWSDFRDVRVTRPLFGVIPRRLAGVVVISFLVATFLVVLWGRHAEADPGSTAEVFGRITVIWAAAAFGGALGDILPGESRGTDVTLENIGERIGGR